MPAPAKDPQTSVDVIPAANTVALPANYQVGDARIEIGTYPAQPQPGRPTLLIFRLTDTSTGQPITAEGLKLKHTKLMHLILVSQDTGFYRHVHPETTSEGLYTFPVTFPAAGQYRLYNEFDLNEGGNSVEGAGHTNAGTAREVLYRYDFTVGTPSTTSAPSLNAGGERTQQLDDLTVSLQVPAQIQAGQPVDFKFDVSRNGQPFAGLEPYLGEPSHMIVIAENGASFRHLHGYAKGTSNSGGTGAMAGMDDKAAGGHVEPDANVRYGPQIGYDLRFEQAGRYKIWAEFQHAGKVLTFSYILIVS
jgi:hypothetical protein